MEQAIGNSIDVRLIEPKFKHSIIFEQFDELMKGESLLLINDHDPKPLYYQLLAERGNIFNWKYEENGPEVWKVRINKKKDTAEESIGEIAAKDLRKVAVFRKYGIDFCCGGKKTISEACEDLKINKEQLETDLMHLENTEQVSKNYNDFPLDFMCDYIVNTHHLYVKQSLPVLLELSAKVSSKHGQKFSELIKINELIVAIEKELTLHIYKEEQVLFPFIKKMVQNQTPDFNISMVKEPIAMMEMEHESVGELFKEIETLSNNYLVPEGACNSFTLLYNTLQEFYIDLTLHIHLENNILFPKTLNLLKIEIR